MDSSSHKRIATIRPAGNAPFHWGRLARGAPIAVVALLTLLVAGCPLLGIWFTWQFCFEPGACGVSGHLLRSRGYDVFEFAPGIGEGPFLGPGGDVRPRGFAFAAHEDDLKLYVGTTAGLQVWDGRQEHRKIADITIPDCLSIGDVLVLEDGDLIVSCSEELRLVRVDAELGSVRQAFDCCSDLPDFEPSMLARGSNGTVFAGQASIYEVDPDNGEILRRAVAAGVLGATSYSDLVFTPGGELLVSAPDAGVLRFTPPDWEFVGVLVPADETGVPTPGPLAITPEGNVLVTTVTIGGLLREFNPITGEFIREWRGDDGGFSVTAMAFRP